MKRQSLNVCNAVNFLNYQQKGDFISPSIVLMYHVCNYPCFQWKLFTLYHVCIIRYQTQKYKNGAKTNHRSISAFHNILSASLIYKRMFLLWSVYMCVYTCTNLLLILKKKPLIKKLTILLKHVCVACLPTKHEVIV